MRQVRGDGAAASMRYERFRYDGLAIDPLHGEVVCRYLLDDHPFEERFGFNGGEWGSAAVGEAARLLYLLAGISYYKAGAPPVIELGDTALTGAEASFLRRYYIDGLGEFAYRNHLDLRGIELVAAERAPRTPPRTPSRTPSPKASGDLAWPPLIPFGGGIDSIVTVADVAGGGGPGPALFVVNRPGDRFAAIEGAAAVSGLPIVRCERSLDPAILRSSVLGFLNGHVPVTGIISAAACVAAALDGFRAVVMSNEWSASSPNLEVDGRPVNHQWSKSIDFESGFRSILAEAVPGLEYFSWLRARSELWVAERFAALGEYHGLFRSCNRAFHVDPSRRLDHWCGSCDKCCFVDLVLAPFMERSRLEEVFGGREPLADVALTDRFRTLLGLAPDAKPFECVGDTDECRIALRLAARRPDREGCLLVQALVQELPPLPPLPPIPAQVDELASRMAKPLGPHFVPDAYSSRAQLV